MDTQDRSKLIKSAEEAGKVIREIEKRDMNTQETPEAPHVGALHMQDILDEFRSQTYHAITRLYSYDEVKELLTLQQERHKEEMREVLEGLRIGQNVIINCVSRGDYRESSRCQGFNEAITEILDIINKKIQNL